MILEKILLFWIITVCNWFVDLTRAAIYAIQFKTRMSFMLSILSKLHLDELSITVLLVKSCKVSYILTNSPPLTLMAYVIVWCLFALLSGPLLINQRADSYKTA